MSTGAAFFADDAKYPMLGVATGRGGVPHLVPDMVRAAAPPAGCCLVCSVFDAADAAPACRDLGVGYNAFCGVPEYALVLTQRNAAIGMHPSAPGTDDAVASDNGAGRVALAVKDMAALAATVRAAAAVAMCDPVPCDAQEHLPLSKKRRIAATRNAAWSQVATADAAAAAPQQPAAVVVPNAMGAGGGDADDVAADAPWRHSPLVNIPNINLNESPASRAALLAQCAALAAPKTVFLFTADTMAALVDGVAALDGRCVVSTPLPLQLAKRGMALRIPVAALGTGAVAGGEPGVLNLWDPAFEYDRTPLVAGCACAACRRHTRGYLHHLLRVHEMNSDMLLLAHNLHTVAAVVAALRAARAAGSMAAVAADLKACCASW
jgi:queuine tRNA-ribosyltransferase subunit QTRTD1